MNAKINTEGPPGALSPLTEQFTAAAKVPQFTATKVLTFKKRNSRQCVKMTKFTHNDSRSYTQVEDVIRKVSKWSLGRQMMTQWLLKGPHRVNISQYFEPQQFRITGMKKKPSKHIYWVKSKITQVTILQLSRPQWDL